MMLLPKGHWEQVALDPPCQSSPTETSPESVARRKFERVLFGPTVPSVPASTTGVMELLSSLSVALLSVD